MKLHLPKALLTAVLAACMVNTTAWATSDNTDHSGWDKIADSKGNPVTDSYAIGDITITSVDTGDSTSDSNTLFIRSNNGVDTATVTSFTIGEGKTAKIQGWWTEDDGHPQFELLTISTLTFGNNSVLNVAAGNTVKVDAYTGTFKGTIDGTLTIEGVANLTNAAISGAGSLIITGNPNSNRDTGASVIGGTATISCTSSEIRGTLGIRGNGTLKYTGGTHSVTKLDIHNQNGYKGTDELIVSGATVNVTGTDDSNNMNNASTGPAAVTVGHWNDGTGKISVGGESAGKSVFNVFDGTIRMSYNASSNLTIGKNGIVNAMGIQYSNFHDGVGTDTAVINLQGGRLNLGSGGLSANTSKTDVTLARELNLQSGTLGALASSVNIGAGDVNLSGAVTIDTAILGRDGVATGGKATITFVQALNAQEDATLTIQGGGTVSLSSINMSHTLDLSILDDTNLTIGAVVLNPDTMALRAKEGASAVQYYSMDGGTTQNSEGDGFLYTRGDYVLFDGYAWNGTLGNGLTARSEGNNTYVSTAGTAGTSYYLTTVKANINASAIGAEAYVVQGGTMNIEGTMYGSDIQYTRGSISLANKNSTLVLDSASNAASLLSLVTTMEDDAGTIKLTTNTTMSGAAQAKGKLIVEGASLKVELPKVDNNNGPNKNINTWLSSFTSIDLNNATVLYHGSTTTWQNVTVGTTGATLKIRDMDSNNNDKDLSLAGTTTLNGDFTIESSWENNAQTWKYGVNIAALTGSGDLTIKGTTHAWSTGEQNRVRAKLLSTYTGTITAEQSSNNTSVTQVYLSADGNINLTGLNITGGATVDLSGVTGTKNLGNVVIDGSSSLSLTGQLGNMAASGAGALTLAAGTSTSGTVSIANALTIAGTIANTGSFTLTNNVTIADIDKLSKDITYSGNGGLDGYISNILYYVVQSSGSGSASVAEGKTLNNTYGITSSDGSLVFEVQNATPGGIYYVNTQDFLVDGSAENAAKDATGYKIAAGKTLTISAAQSESMTAGKILSEATGEGNIELNTNASYSGNIASQAKGKLTINKGVTLSVGYGSADSSNISSFSSVDLKGGALSLNGASSEVKSLTVSEAKGTLTVKNANSDHQTYTLSGTTTLNADLDITSPNEHGDVIVKELTGSKNLSIVGGNADWGGIMVRLEKLTDYTGSITVDNEGRAASPNGPKYTNIEFGTAAAAAFTTLKGLEIKGNAYATVYAKGESTIESLTLANGTLNVLNLKTNDSDADGHQTTNITSLSIDKTGTLGTTRSSSCYHGTINVVSLSHTGDSAALTLMNGSQCDATTTINLNGGSLKGAINVESNAVAGVDQNRKLQVNINASDLAKDAVINFRDPSTGNTTGNEDLLANNKQGNYNILGVGAKTVNVAGLTGETTRAATIKSTDSSTRTLQIITAQGADYKTNANVEKSVNLVKSGEGSQTFTSSVASTSVSVLGGGLSLTGIDTLQLQDLVVKSGATLSVGSNGSGVVSVVTSPAAPASTTSSTQGAKLEGGATINGGLDLSGATSLTLDGVGSNAVKINGDLKLTTGSLTLSGDVLSALAEIEAGEHLTIMTIGENLIVNDQVITESITADSMGYSFAEVFTNEGYDDFYLGFNYVPADEAGYSTVYIGMIVPEPTTATLSLLALAALAARRRRR